jgi:hypothetical protein
MLFALEDQRSALLVQSRRACLEENPAEALRFALAAHNLRQGDDSERWLAALHLISGNFGEAWRLYRSA